MGGHDEKLKNFGQSEFDFTNRKKNHFTTIREKIFFEIQQIRKNQLMFKNR